jgi:gamma-glutamyl-gamma-aminobutyrate hydrolase PuuD
MSLNVFIVTPQFGYDRMFNDKGWAVVSDMRDADLVLFTGGEDVSPFLYGEQKHPHTYSSKQRDEYEREEFRKAIELDIPCVGICRGGQFLNVMNGGRMFQHVEKHTRSHHLTDLLTGEEVLVTSTHHQMMRPAEHAVVVATANEGGSKEWMIEDVINVTLAPTDYEVIWYPQTLSLCFQPHPEYGNYPECTEYFFSLLKRYIKL